MKEAFCFSAIVAAAMCMASTATAQAPVGTTFTYQGRLKDGGGPANGPYDMHFRLYDAATDGAQLGPTICYNNASVADGLFMVALDFGDHFTGQERFLEVAIRVDAGQNCANTSGFTTLSPRQKLTAAPNALFALNADQLDGLDSTAFLQSIPVPLTLTGTSTTHIIRADNASDAVHSTAMFAVSTDTSAPTYGGYFESASTAGTAIYGLASAASGTTVGGNFASASTDGRGVFGNASAATGTTYGGYFRSISTGGVGVFGLASIGTGTTYGGKFQSVSTSGTGVFGLANATSGTTYGLWAQSDSTGGFGAFGEATAPSGTTYGVYGRSASTGGRGVFGVATAASGSTFGGYFESASPSGRAVYGRATATTGDARGVYGVTDSTSGLGIVGYATPTTGTTYGVYGQSDSSAGFAGYFVGRGSDALYVRNDANGRGIQVIAANDTGLWASTTAGIAGVDGRNASTTGRGVYGYATAASGENYGVYGRTSSAEGRGVYGTATAASGITYGGYFEAQSSLGTAVYGRVTATGAGATPYGVAGYCNTATAGYAVYALGDLGASGIKPFRIDHPDDPENKYLLHYAAESPEVINFYRGTVVLDERGKAVVELPHYFAKINKTPSYQLTAIGAPMPNLHVAEKISPEALVAGEQAGADEAAPDCSFRIAGGVPGAEVSWEVKALRNDLRMRLHGAPVEKEKAAPERGKYQHPEYYGQPREMGMDYQEDREVGATGGAEAAGR